MTDNEFKKLVDRIDDEYGGPRRRVVITFPLLSEGQLAAIRDAVRAAAGEQEFLDLAAIQKALLTSAREQEFLESNIRDPR